MFHYLGHIEEETLQNSNFRTVLFTTQHLQLVLMCLKPNEEIGEEVHSTTDQFFRVEAGEGLLVLNGKEHKVKDGDAMVVVAGTEHNLINTSSTQELKLYTIYAPAHHVGGTVHATKAAAEADTKDHL
jgi:mannose-6-phosphate isomerase-like protein (cupin superfamily)